MYQVLLFKFRHHLCKGSIPVQKEMKIELIKAEARKERVSGKKTDPNFLKLISLLYDPRIILFGFCFYPSR